MNDAISIHCLKAKFTRKMWPMLLALVLLPIFCSLGVWQYHRSAWKAELLANYANRKHSPALTLEDLANKKDIQYYQLKINGKLDTSHELLVENKFYQHQLGYEIITPLILSDGSMILVNRGWNARYKHTPIYDGDVNGTIVKLQNKIFQLGTIPPSNTWPKPIQNKSWAEIHRVFPNAKLQPFMLLLDEKSPQAFTPIYKPTIMPPEKHMGYAFQWFAMALVMLIILVTQGVKLCKTEKS